MSAATTPRVRILAVCDEAVPSDIEDGVFTLEGVRQGFGAESFPCALALSVYLLLSYPRRSRFNGEVKMVTADEERTVRITKFSADFTDAPSSVPLAIDLGDCTFPEPGVYSIGIRFLTSAGAVLKAEQPILVWQQEE
jgi:hypothetical protein